MANGSEKYQANRENNQEESSEAGKKTAKVAAKGAVANFTGGKGGVVVDKLANTKIGNQVLNKFGKVIDKNLMLNKATQNLNHLGINDAVNKNHPMTKNNYKGGKRGEKTSSINTDDMTSFSNKNPSLMEESYEESSLNNENEDNSSFNIISKAKGNMGIKIAIIASSSFLLLIIMFFGILSGSDENGTDPAIVHSNDNYNENDFYLTDDLQAEQLCQLHDQGKYDEWINLFGPIAQKDYSRTGVFASITMAQAMIESGWGCANIRNNLFGIKCHGYSTCVSTNTKEEYDGQLVSIVDSFRAYPSVANSIEDHSRFLRENGIYANAGVFSAKDYKEQAYALKRAGYATGSGYAEKLISQIEYYNLDRFDVIVDTSSSASTGGGNINSASGWGIRTTKPLPSDRAFNYISGNRGQCVWYAQARAIEIAEELASKGKISEEQVSVIRDRLLNTNAHGGNWYDYTRGKFKGSSNVEDVKAGSLISWKKPGGYGHVAVIEEVTGDTVTISEGWATNTKSCPTNWNCVNFRNKTYSKDDFYNSFGKYYNGAYVLSGYVYFLELEG